MQKLVSRIFSSETQRPSGRVAVADARCPRSSRCRCRRANGAASAPLEAQEASYLAASARMASLRSTFMWIQKGRVLDEYTADVACPGGQGLKAQGLSILQSRRGARSQCPYDLPQRPAPRATRRGPRPVTLPQGLTLQAVRDLAWAGQHERAIEECARALRDATLPAGERLAWLDLRSASLAAQGLLDDAMRDARAMLETARRRRAPSRSSRRSTG